MNEFKFACIHVLDFNLKSQLSFNFMFAGKWNGVNFRKSDKTTEKRIKIGTNDRSAQKNLNFADFPDRGPITKILDKEVTWSI
jgi:hypothetical protein